MGFRAETARREHNKGPASAPARHERVRRRDESAPQGAAWGSSIERMIASRSFVASLLVLGAAAGADEFTVTPAAPAAGQFVRVTVRHDQGCPLVDHLAETFDQGVRFTFFEACECPPGIYGHVDVSATLAPVHAGELRASAQLQRVAGDAFCGPALPLAETTVAVAPSSDFHVAVDPPLPAAGSPVSVTIDSSCPFDWSDPTRDRFNLYFFAGDSPIGAPCTTPPSFREIIQVGALAAGEYTVILLTDHPEAPAHLFQQRFTVTEHAIPALLIGDHFEVTAAWETHAGATGTGTARPLTAETGAFWFFTPSNLEVTVKILDGCAINGHRWLMAAGMTDVGVELTVLDIQTGAERTYDSPLGTPFAPILDTSAFACF